MRIVLIRTYIYLIRELIYGSAESIGREAAPDGAVLAKRCVVGELAGPIAPLFRFNTEAEAIRMAKATEFGLATYFYTRDLARSWWVAEALE